jgi:rRNA maturation RNase YbeY
MLDNTLEIYNETKTTIPKIDFLKLKNAILGKNFELQISILLGKNSKKINQKQRKQKYIPNTLSFKYSENSGEIILTPEVVETEDYELNTKPLTKYDDKFLFLIIHSMLHLTDLDHGDKMEKLEHKYFEKFS